MTQLDIEPTQMQDSHFVTANKYSDDHLFDESVKNLNFATPTPQNQKLEEIKEEPNTIFN